ncbi:hypothetical protein C9374_009016 [Naegleria lovaniensis]|uniref:At4g15545-like C-terminal domain-containing protein n=1 Tax=Naegleria lovaniensis TaxID=51637 RepID=A0AA88GK55_NAELO|nr:uncharacterized protein C9374_009016 [Naegleria lovaniensis]KAG2377931.1 hypothetical protein C9374_009016 [Naegleria lovaniensis]
MSNQKESNTGSTSGSAPAKFQFDDLIQMLKKSFLEETKELRDEVMEWKVKCKELEKQNSILDYRVKGSNNKIVELEKKVEELEEQKNASLRKYYDLKKEYEDLTQFKASITSMVSPTKEKPKAPILSSSSTYTSSIASVATNLTSKFSSPEVRKTGSTGVGDFSSLSSDSVLETPHHQKDNVPVLTTSQQRSRYGSDSPIVIHSKSPTSYHRDQPYRSRSATLSSQRKRSSILKDSSSFSREKNVKFSPNTKGSDDLMSNNSSFVAPPTPHSSFGVQYSKRADTTKSSETTSSNTENSRSNSERLTSTPSRRFASDSGDLKLDNSTRRQNSLDIDMLNEDTEDGGAQELYLKVKKALTPEEFKAFSSNIRKLNMGEQSITTTLVNLREVIGEDRQHLYAQLKRAISSGEM